MLHCQNKQNIGNFSKILKIKIIHPKRQRYTEIFQNIDIFCKKLLYKNLLRWEKSKNQCKFSKIGWNLHLILYKSSAK